MRAVTNFKLACLLVLPIFTSNALAIEPVSVSASADDGNIPENTLDKDLGTRWSALGNGQWIQYDLGQLMDVRNIDVAFYKGDQRTADIEIQLSADANSFTTVFNGSQPQLTTDLQNINFADMDARYVRVVGFGNSSNNWNSITEFEVEAIPLALPSPSPSPTPVVVTPTPSPTPTPVTSPTPLPTHIPPTISLGVTASTDDGNVPGNTIDGDFGTRWSAQGDGQWISYELLGIENYIAWVDIAFFKGDQRTATFDIQVSNDGNNWTTVWEGDQPQLTLDLQRFDINTMAKFVRIVGFGNSANTWNSITEFNIVAFALIPSVIPTPTPSSTPTPIPTPSPVASPSPSPLPTVSPLPSTALDTVPEINCTMEVSSVSALENNTGWDMSPGTTLCLTDGTYRDVELQLGGNGTESQPITVAAKNPGSVFFEGEAQVRMSGSYIVFQGITFRNGNSSSSDLFQTRGSGNAPCDYCRITEVTITDWDQEFEDSNRWFLIFGQHNRIDHSWFSGKKTRGALLTVDRGEITDPDYAQIDHNYFGDRLPFGGGEFPAGTDNEFEGIRIGTSDTQAFPSYSRVEYNYMERIRGEAEIISNKAGFNVISDNTIRSSYGAIVNRHGSDAIISNNFIFSDGYGMSAGIRLAGANHQVFNNYIEGCTFTGSNFNGGIVLTKTAGSQATSGYQQVDNVMIAHNTIVNCVNSINLAGGQSSSSTLPRNVNLFNNVIHDAVGDVFVSEIPSGTTFSGNYVDGDSLGLSSAPNGVEFINPQLSQGSDGLYRPSSSSPVIASGDGDLGDFPAVTVDMDGQNRRANNPDSGADELTSGEVTSGEVTKRPLTAVDVGPKNYRP